MFLGLQPHPINHILAIPHRNRLRRLEAQLQLPPMSLTSSSGFIMTETVGSMPALTTLPHLIPHTDILSLQFCAHGIRGRPALRSDYGSLCAAPAAKEKRLSRRGNILQQFVYIQRAQTIEGFNSPGAYYLATFIYQTRCGGVRGGGCCPGWSGRNERLRWGYTQTSTRWKRRRKLGR